MFRLRFLITIAAAQWSIATISAVGAEPPGEERRSAWSSSISSETAPLSQVGPSLNSNGTRTSGVAGLPPRLESYDHRTLSPATGDDLRAKYRKTEQIALWIWIGYMVLGIPVARAHVREQRMAESMRAADKVIEESSIGVWLVLLFVWPLLLLNKLLTKPKPPRSPGRSGG
jgi:hypothetical protein